MRKANRLMLGAAVLALLLVHPFQLARAQETDCDQAIVKTTLTELNSSGVTGTAILCIGEDGASARIKAENVTSGHLFTSWFFYTESSTTAGPGRFDSALSEGNKVRFRGRVGGLAASSGATVKLVILDHGTPSSNNVTRATNVLTPTGGTAVAKAVFTPSLKHR